MADGGKSAASKVVTANKLLPSILHGTAPLLPQGLSGCKRKDEPGRLLLLESIDDDALWFAYIKLTKDGEHLEEACRLYPNYWKAHQRSALFHLFHKRTRKAFEVYTKAMRTIEDYHLHVCYLKFLYHMASVHEYIGALFAAIDKVGLDHRSDPLWKEALTVLVKIYNSNILERNVHSGLLPHLFPTEPGISTGGGPLLPSEAEKLVFRGVNTLDKGEQTYVQMYGEVNHLRKFFHRWLRTPTSNLRHAWEGYSTFENIASAANVLSTKLLADAKVTFERAAAVYDKLAGMYGKVYPAKPATRRPLGADAAAERQRVLGQWVELIKYEERNPLELAAEEMVERVAFTFRAALTPYVFSPRLWYMYFQFLLVNDQRDKAVTDMKSAISNFLKEDDRVQFILAAYLDDAGEATAAATEFKRLVDPGLKLIDEGEPEKEDAQLRQLLQLDDAGLAAQVPPMKLVHYLNHVRRNRGRARWRDDLQLLLTKRELQSWELFWYAADTEVRCFRDVPSAVAVLHRAHQSLPFDMQYTMRHLRFLLGVGCVLEARVLLTELLVGAAVTGDRRCKLSAVDSAALWHFWMHTEYFFGSKAQFAHVKQLYINHRIAGEVGLDTFAEKSRAPSTSSIRQIFSDIGALFMKTHMDSTKRQASVDMNAIAAARQRMFCAGLDFDELDEVFMLGDREAGLAAAPAPADAVTPSAAATPSASHKLVDSGTAAPAFTRRSAVAEPEPSRRVAITRPDVGALAALDPENTSGMEALVTLHGAKRPTLPISARPLDAVGTPPKVLFDLLRVLPTPAHKEAFHRAYGGQDAIEYLVRSLEHVDVSTVPLHDYSPLPIAQLLHIQQAAASDGQSATVGPANDDDVVITSQDAFDSAMAEGAFDLNNGLFSILRFVEGHACAGAAESDAGGPAKRACNKQKLAI